jgi:dTDP-4-amino-4,6-dideoxygalactose transaminase
MGAGEYKVPSKDYTLQYKELLPDLLPALEKALLEENPVLGQSVATFEDRFATLIGTEYAIGLNSGTDSLLLALRALGIGPGDEVITAANTFIATVSAIIMAGARPVLVDPDPETMNISARGLEQGLTGRTAAVIPVHLYGALAPMGEIGALCRNRQLAVVEDAAQAHGAADEHQRRAGSFGIMGCFSFHPSKNLGAFGDGGMITTSEQRIAESIRVMRNLGKTTRYDIEQAAPNTKLDTIQAVILLHKLKHLDNWNRRRREIAGIYRQALEGVGDLRLPHDPGDQSHVYHLYVVRSDRRDQLRIHLKTAGINAGLHYPVPPHLQKMNEDLGYREGAFPITEQCCRTVLSLPVAPELTNSQVEYVCEQVRDFFGT